jgi:oligopeptide/dipeptide ABC transporter ATP-binding protein
MLITHDLAVVAGTADIVAVMYASKIVELADVGALFGEPLHPYTHGLFRSIPKLGERQARLATIPGTVPNPLALPDGCKFHPRCDLTRRLAAEAHDVDAADVPTADGTGRVLRRCATREPPLREVRPGHWCACWECPGHRGAAETDPAEGPASSGGESV